MDKQIVIAVVIEVGLLCFLVWKWWHRHEEQQTSSQPDDVKRLETLETRVSAKRRRESGGWVKALRVMVKGERERIKRRG